MAPRKKKPTSEQAALAVLTPEAVATLVEERTHAELALQSIAQSTIDTDEDMQGMTDFILMLREKRCRIEAQLATIVDPSKAAIKAAKAVFDPPIELLKAGEKAGKFAIDRRLDAQRAAQTAAQLQVSTSPLVSSAVLSAATGQENLALPAGSYERVEWPYTLDKDGLVLLDAAVCQYLLARGVPAHYVNHIAANHLEPKAYPADARVAELLTLDDTGIKAIVKAEKAECSLPGVSVTRSAKVVVVG